MLSLSQSDTIAAQVFLHRLVITRCSCVSRPSIMVWGVNSVSLACLAVIVVVAVCVVLATTSPGNDCLGALPRAVPALYVPSAF